MILNPFSLLPNYTLPHAEIIMHDNDVSTIGCKVSFAGQTAHILSVPIHNIPLAELLAAIGETLRNREKLLLGYANVHAINLTIDEPRLAQFYRETADLVFCDGMGVRLGAWFMGQRLDYRYTPPDWIDDLCRLCVEQRASLFLLGARDGVGEHAAQTLHTRHPELQIVGVHHGYFDKHDLSVVDIINRSSADVLLVGMGMPVQELWLMDHWHRLNVRVGIPVGAMFDYLSGRVPRAPHWMTDNGLEWLGRLLFEPRRLWRRYLIGLPLFALRIALHQLGNKRTGTRQR
jgi:N-acetylglucosaminyldiphosphoundecaprenol N-acetyl-beta-D-mannosaminyltransferase